jgi:FixJ family two-component response regulator
MLCQFFKVAGAESCAGYGSVAALQASADSVLLGTLAILDVNLGPDAPSGIDAFRWLKERAFPGEIIFLTGHARSHPLVKACYELPNVQVLEKPIEPKVLRVLAKTGRLP